MGEKEEFDDPGRMVISLIAVIIICILLRIVFGEPQTTYRLGNERINSYIESVEAPEAAE